MRREINGSVFHHFIMQMWSNRRLKRTKCKNLPKQSSCPNGDGLFTVSGALWVILGPEWHLSVFSWIRFTESDEIYILIITPINVCVCVRAVVLATRRSPGGGGADGVNKAEEIIIYDFNLLVRAFGETCSIAVGKMDCVFCSNKKFSSTAGSAEICCCITERNVSLAE